MLIFLHIIIYFKINVAAQFMPPPGQPFPFPFPSPGSAPLQGIPIPPLPPSGPLVQPPLSRPMPYPMPQAKLPVVVMPYYSKANKRVLKHKRRRQQKKYKHFTSSESDTSDSITSNEFEFRAKRHPKRRRREPLTPVISYVTKDGYIVYQKKIKKDTAKDWLNLGKKNLLPD